MKIFVDEFPCPERRADLPGVAEMQVIYQHPADPDSMLTGIITPSKMKDMPVLPVVALDFETPMGEWMEGTGEQRRLCTQSLRAATRYLKRTWPGVSFAFYGFPGLPTWPRGMKWSDLSNPQAWQVLEDHKAQWTEALSTSQWLAPCLYDSNTYGDGMDLEEETLYRRMHIKAAKALRPDRAIMPFICMHSAPNGAQSTEHRQLSIKRIMDVQVQPCIDMKVTGVVIWGKFKHYLDTACIYQPSELQAVLRKEYTESWNLTPTFWKDPQGALRILTGLMHERLKALVTEII